MLHLIHLSLSLSLSLFVSVVTACMLATTPAEWSFGGGAMQAAFNLSLRVVSFVGGGCCKFI